MNCTTCGKELPEIGELKPSEIVTVKRECSCGTIHELEFAKPSESNGSIHMAGRLFTMTRGNVLYAGLYKAVAQDVLYVDCLTGRSYLVEAYAYEIGTMIYSYLYINGQQRGNTSEWYKAPENNPLFYRYSDPLYALQSAMRHGESLVKLMVIADDSLPAIKEAEVTNVILTPKRDKSARCFMCGSENWIMKDEHGAICAKCYEGM